MYLFLFFFLFCAMFFYTNNGLFAIVWKCLEVFDGMFLLFDVIRWDMNFFLPVCMSVHGIILFLLKVNRVMEYE
jgi:hypothetical protein